MWQRSVEILFKHKFLLLLPFVVIMPMMIALALQPQPKRWSTSATIWVDQYRPLYVDDRLGYSPANSMSQLFNNFLRSRSFARSVLKQTQYAPYLDTPIGEEAALADLWSGVRVYPSSNTFIRLTATMRDPEVAVTVARTVLQEFQTELRKRRETQTNTALGFYQEALNKAQKDLEKARLELVVYLAAHPELFERTPEGLQPSAIREQDSNYTRLNSQTQFAEASYSEARKRYEDLQTSAAAGFEGQELSFVVVDQPEQPLRPFTERRLSLLKLPLIGLVLGLILSAAIATILIITNRAVLGVRDLRSAFALPVLAEIPELRRKRWLWQRRPYDAVRMKLVGPARSAPHSGR
jgi:uncharacterized protein involved in exopolysaccharide biosynthesis